MLPRLQAEQALDRIHQVAAGSGTMEPSAHKQFMRELRRAASNGRHRAQKVTLAWLAQHKIAVETLPPREPK